MYIRYFQLRPPGQAVRTGDQRQLKILPGISEAVRPQVQIQGLKYISLHLSGLLHYYFALKAAHYSLSFGCFKLAV